MGASRTHYRPTLLRNGYARARPTAHNIATEPHNNPPAQPFPNQRTVALKFRIRSQMDREVAHSHQHRHQRRPAEPAHRPRHQLGIDFDSQLGIAPLHRWRQYQIEEIEQADPDDAENEMQPTQEYHFFRPRRAQEPE